MQGDEQAGQDFRKAVIRSHGFFRGGLQVFPAFCHLAIAAARAISVRRCGLKTFARAGPPILPIKEHAFLINCSGSSISEGSIAVRLYNIYA